MRGMPSGSTARTPLRQHAKPAQPATTRLQPQKASRVASLLRRDTTQRKGGPLPREGGWGMGRVVALNANLSAYCRNGHPEAGGISHRTGFRRQDAGTPRKGSPQSRHHPDTRSPSHPITQSPNYPSPLQNSPAERGPALMPYRGFLPQSCAGRLRTTMWCAGQAPTGRKTPSPGHSRRSPKTEPQASVVTA